jgi:hypothetical protein
MVDMFRYGKVLSYLVMLSIVLSALLMACEQPKPPPPVKPVNQKPVVTAIRGPAEIVPGGQGEFSCEAFDPDGDIVSYEWSATQGEFKGTGAKVQFMAPDKSGTCMITANVKDNNGASGIGVKEIKITESAGAYTGEKPLVLNIKLGSVEPATDSARVRIWFSALVECNVEGGDGSTLTYTWNSTGGKLQGKGLAEGTAGKVAWIAPGGAGDYKLDVTVRDAKGNTGTGTINFKVFCCGN